MFNSTAAESATEAAAISRGGSMLAVGRGDTMASLAQRMAYSDYQWRNGFSAEPADRDEPVDAGAEGENRGVCQP